MNLLQTINKLGEYVGEPDVPPAEYVEQFVYGFNKSTLAESARIIKENQQLARDMGVEIES